jgi:hypothetical protein
MNQPMVILQYNQESAAKAGGGEFLSQGGAYVVDITEAKFVTAKTGSNGIEFSIKTDDGLKANYISVYYAKAPATQGGAGEPITGGQSALNALMGILRVERMTAVKTGDSWFCPEFTGKKVGMFLQKKLTSKSTGEDSYGFELSVPFNPVDRKTMREIIGNLPAQTIDRMTASYKDKDERKSKTSGSSVGSQAGYDDYSNMGGHHQF